MPDLTAVFILTLHLTVTIFGSEIPVNVRPDKAVAYTTSAECLAQRPRVRREFAPDVMFKPFIKHVRVVCDKIEIKTNGK